MREIKLPSGATLKVAPAPFAISKDLYQAVLRDMKEVSIKDGLDIAEILKQFFCVGFSSKEVEALTWKCLERCLYNGERITEDTFEPIERRDDYLKVVAEVVKENVLPFAKSLYAEFKAAMQMMPAIQG